MSEQAYEAPESATDDADATAVVDEGVELEQMRARLREVEGRNQFLETRFVEAARPRWLAEAKRLHPEVASLDPNAFDDIDATSRRRFQAKAAERASRYTPAVARVEALREQARLEARREVAAAWGTPAGDFLGAAVEPAAAEKAKTLGGAVRALLERGA
jgi:hypothetical protein